MDSIYSGEAELKGMHLRTDYRRKRITVGIRRDLGLRERVVTLIHELFHLDPERDFLTEGGIKKFQQQFSELMDYILENLLKLKRL